MHGQCSINISCYYYYNLKWELSLLAGMVRFETGGKDDATLRLDEKRGDRKSAWDEVARTPLVCSHTSDIWQGIRRRTQSLYPQVTWPFMTAFLAWDSISFWRSTEKAQGRRERERLWAMILAPLVTSYGTLGKSNSEGLSFLICQMGIIIIPWVVMQIKWL